MPETMILRFRDLSTELGETIRQHKLLSDAKGHVWWGWWKKQGETVPVSAFQALVQTAKRVGGLKIYLFDTGTLTLYSATLADIVWDRMFEYIPSPDRQATPNYYGDNKYLAWFKLTEINTDPLPEISLKDWSYLRVEEFFDDKRSIFIEFYDKQIFSFLELKYQERTIWFTRKRLPEDRTYEIRVYDRGRAVPSNFPPGPVASPSTVLLWISDLHFGEHHNYPLSSNVHANNLSETLRKDLEALDIMEIAGLIVSGDLTWKADAVEYEHCQKFVEDIKSWATLSSDQIVICLGNHDIAFSKEPWKKGTAVNVASNEARRQFAEFYQKMFYLFPNEFLCSGRRFLIGNGVAVEVASLNSSLLDQKPGVFQGQGYLSDGQLEFMAGALGWQQAVEDAPRAFRIVVLHHHVVPILYREVPVYEAQSSVVYDAGALCRWLARWEIDLVLHGHMHDPAIVKEARRRSDVREATEWREFTVACLGSTGVKLDHTADNRNSYGILQFGRQRASLRLRQIDRSGRIPDYEKDIMNVQIPYKTAQ